MATETLSRDEVLALAGILGVAGLGLVVLSLTGGPGDQTAPLDPGEAVGEITCQTLEVPGAIRIPLGQPYVVNNPKLPYKGPGRDTYTTFSILQKQSGAYVTVYSSGVAGVHVGPANTLTVFGLVSPDQPQPDGSKSAILLAVPWPGVPNNPISGAPARLGPADAMIAVYQRKAPEDADGFASPTINGRKWIARRIWPDKILFLSAV